jgi:hypothetical protein
LVPFIHLNSIMSEQATETPTTSTEAPAQHTETKQESQCDIIGSITSGVVTGVNAVASVSGDVASGVTSSVTPAASSTLGGVTSFFGAVANVFTAGNKIEQRPLGSQGLVVSMQGVSPRSNFIYDEWF